MRILTCIAIGVAALLMAPSSAVLAQQKVDLGKREYDSNCMICHGAKGKGDGMYRANLTRPPTDLTTLSQRNGGVFPFQTVYESIDGTRDIAAHGPRDMPIWGMVYRSRAGEFYGPDVPYDPNAFVRARIYALIDYVQRLQVK